MQFDFTRLPSQIIYKILTASVTPRPIAWVTTRSAEGINNAAPYSFFNVMGHEPPTVAIGVMRDPARGRKDTAANILAQREFVVHLVPHRLAESMSLTSAGLPSDKDELKHAGVDVVEADTVRAPRIVAAPVAFECKASHCIETGPDQYVMLGVVHRAHIDDRYVLSREQGYIDAPALDLVSRLHGSGWYGHFPEMFKLERPSSGAAVLDRPTETNVADNAACREPKVRSTR